MIIRDLAGHFASDKDQQSDVFENIKAGKLQFVQDSVSDVNATDRAGFSLLCVAVQCWEEEIVKFLLSKRADVNLGCTQGLQASPLHYAAMSGCLPIFRLLLNAYVESQCYTWCIKQ